MSSIIHDNTYLISGLLKGYERIQKDPLYIMQDFGNAYARFLKSIGIRIASDEKKARVLAEELVEDEQMHIAIVSRRLLNEWLREMIAQKVDLKTLIEQKAS